MPADVDVDAGTAHLIAVHADPMVMNSLAGCTGRYTGAGGWTWRGGSLDGANSSTHGFSLAHCPRATISGATACQAGSDWMSGLGAAAGLVTSVQGRA